MATHILNITFALVAVSVFLFLVFLKFGLIPEQYFLLTLGLCPVYYFLNLFFRSSSYVNVQIFEIVIRNLFSNFAILLIFTSITFALKISSDFSRLLIFQTIFTSFFFNLLIILSIKKFFKQDKKNIVLIAPRDQHLQFFKKDISQFTRIFDQKNLSDYDNYLENNFINQVYIYLPLNYLNEIDTWQKQLSKHPYPLKWILPEFSGSLSNRKIFGPLESAINIYPSIYELDTNQLYAKRFIDIFIATFIATLISPLLLLVSVLVICDGLGPVIFRQKRHGLNGEIFYIYKFRTMKNHKSNKLIQASKNDTRVTRIGKILRATSIDELPQLFNVINGDMSLVGPRPHAIEHNNYYSKKLRNFMLRHRVKPGITGLAQVNGYRGETDTIEKMEGRLKYDLIYLRNWSLFLDFKILFNTPVSLFKHKAY